MPRDEWCDDELASLRILAGDEGAVSDSELAKIIAASGGDLTLASNHLLELLNTRELDKQQRVPPPQVSALTFGTLTNH